MSSHHFVKEGQEPALLIIDAVDVSVAEPLLEWAPLVIVMENVIDEVLAWGIKIDVVLASESNENLKEKLLSQSPVKIVVVENVTLENALNFLIELKQKAVSILVEDPELAIPQVAAFIDRLTINLQSDSIKWSGIGSGSFKKWFPVGSRLKFQGLDPRKYGDYLVQQQDHFQVIRDGLLELSSSSPFWVGETVEK